MTIFGLYITTCKRYDADVDALIMEITDAAAERIKSLEDQLKRERRQNSRSTIGRAVYNQLMGSPGPAFERGNK